MTPDTVEKNTGVFSGDTLKVGDWVFVDGRDTFERRQILRVTPTQIVVFLYKVERKFNKKDLSCRTDRWSYLFLREDNEENRVRAHRNETIKAVQSMAYEIYNTIPYHKLDIEHLDDIKEKMEILIRHSKDALKIATIQNR